MEIISREYRNKAEGRLTAIVDDVKVDGDSLDTPAAC